MKMYLLLVAFNSLLIASCSEKPDIIVKKCDTKFGLPAGSYEFSESGNLYRKSSEHMINIRKYSGEENIILNKNCGYKEAETVSCFGFIDMDKSIGFKVCVSPKNGDLQSYALQN